MVDKQKIEVITGRDRRRYRKRRTEGNTGADRKDV